MINEFDDPSAAAWAQYDRFLETRDFADFPGQSLIQRAKRADDMKRFYEKVDKALMSAA